MRRIVSLCLLIVFSFNHAACSEEAKPKKIVLIAGKKSHGPGVHEYEKSVRLLKVMLDNADNLSGYETEIHFNGWPTDPTTLDDADTIVTISDGRDGNKFSPVPWMTEQRMAVMRKQMQRGCGFVTLHFSTFASDRWGKDVLEWGGGYFDWEDENGERNWYSAIQTLKSKVELGSPEHPISSGLTEHDFRDEFYYKIRFRENDPRLKPIWRVPALGEGLDNVVAWAVEREEGGRGFSTTCGHFYDNWEDDQFRKLMLNAIVWTAGGDVPAGGVSADYYPDEEVARMLAGPPVKAIIVTGHQYPGHLWKDTTPALHEALSRDARMQVSIVEEVEFLAKPALHEYDVVILNYCNWQRPGLSEAAKANFIKYLQDDGGLTIVHFTNGAFHFSLPEAAESDWPEWRTKICRRVWDHTPGKSGHDAYGKFVVEIAQPEHPIAAGMESFETTDELYFRQQGEEPVEVIATARSQITGQNEPMAFVYDYGKGRVFQTVLGHSADSLRVDGTAELVCRGSLWAADRDPKILPNPQRLQAPVEPLVPGKFGKALNGNRASAEAAHRAEYQTWPLTIESRARVDSKEGFQILVAKNLKSSGKHWEIYSYSGTGEFSAYLPGYQPAENKSSRDIADGKWHDLGMTFDGKQLRLFVDGEQVLERELEQIKPGGADGPLWFGSYPEHQLGLAGAIDVVRLSKGVRDLTIRSDKAWTDDEQTLGLWNFDQVEKDDQFLDRGLLKNSAVLKGAKGQQRAKVSALPVDVFEDIVEGHWGHDAVGFGWTEADSVDGRLNQMQTGPFYSGTIATPGGLTMKGLCIKLGDDAQAGLCYDTELLRVSAGWEGGFLEFNPTRYGLITPPKPLGKPVFKSQLLPGWSKTEQFADPRPDAPLGPLPKDVAHYRGLYRFGQRVVISYSVGKTSVLESPWIEKQGDAQVFTRQLEIGPSEDAWNLLLGDQQVQAAIVCEGGEATLVKKSGKCWVTIAPHTEPIQLKIALGKLPTVELQSVGKQMPSNPLSEWTKGGPKLWTHEIVTQGTRGDDDRPYVLDTIKLPFQNPYGALFFTSGHDFFANGDAAVCTVHGDVWRVSGIDDNLQNVRWTRFATGLFQPLGLKIVENVVYVLGRDQITRLHDVNDDGEADWFENFNNDAHVTSNGHEYATCLETDSAGNFYYLKGDSNSRSKHDGSMLRVSKDGATLEVFATGFRNANGMSIGPEDQITAAPQEGTWTPGSAIFSVKQGGFYGAMQSHHREVPPNSFEQPICWMPRIEDNSSGGQAWVTSDRWGPLSDQLLHFSYGTCRMFLVLRETIDGIEQGGTVSFPLTFDSGAMRGRFRPKDGQLYVTGLHGWVSNSVTDGCLQRVRYTGMKPTMPVKVKTWKNGVALTFSDQLDRDSAEEIANYDLSQWNFKWSAEYGSPQWKVSQPNEVGREPVSLVSATLLDDGQTVFLSLPNLQPANILKIDYDIHTADRRPVKQTFHQTINRVGQESLAHPRLNSQVVENAQTDPQGLLLTLTFGANNILKTARIPAFSVSSGEALDPRIDSARRYDVAYRGKVRAPSSEDYRFRLEASSPVGLLIDGKQIEFAGTEKWSEPIFLKRGRHDFELTLTAEPGKSNYLRTWWSSDRFPPEPIPPEMFSHQPNEELARDESAARGEFLFTTHRCVQCHYDDLIGKENTESLTAPALEKLSARVTTDWLNQWLANPHELRNDVLMPAMFSETPEDAQSIADLVTFLTAGSSKEKVTEPSGDTRAGQRQWETLGCIGCHHFEAPNSDDQYGRVSLHFAATKFKTGALAEFIRHGTGHNSFARMPQFKLTDEEADSLETWIRSKSNGTLSEAAEPEGDKQRGHAEFLKRGCITCHADPSSENRLAIRPTESVLLERIDHGCLAKSPPQNVPRYQLSDSARGDLTEFLRNRPGSFFRRQSLGDPQLLWQHLRCATCHTRDGEKNSLPLIIAEDGDIGKIPLGIPDLTWVGEKLDPEWMRQFLHTSLEDKPRSWLETQMPTFPGWSGMLSHGFAAQHGYSNQPVIEPFRPDLVAVGELLVDRAGGLDCRQCHAIGDQRATGDKKTQIALGINFSLVNQRLRKSYFDRFVLDPPRYAPGTRMPKLSADGETTGVRRIYGGDASKQFDAIWNLIQQTK